MTDNEIIKALECCAVHGLLKCEKCPKKNEGVTCMYALSNDALDLIKRQKAENEVLQLNVEDYAETIVELETHSKEQKAEIERLQNILKNGCELSRCINKGWLQSEAIKEFAEKVYRFFCKIQNWKKFKSAVLFNGECDWLKEKFDNLVKEMTDFKE